jgi:hypothetical protein
MAVVAFATASARPFEFMTTLRRLPAMSTVAMNRFIEVDLRLMNAVRAIAVCREGWRGSSQNQTSAKCDHKKFPAQS